MLKKETDTSGNADLSQMSPSCDCLCTAASTSRLHLLFFITSVRLRERAAATYRFLLWRLCTHARAAQIFQKIKRKTNPILIEFEAGTSLFTKTKDEIRIQKK
ncbi:MAG: hypothetical protein LBE57_07460 [Methanosarcinales archaeon]|jgi:hypothetical protein|nr:hypothetical protein [Methanosarcinales archaeon]